MAEIATLSLEVSFSSAPPTDTSSHVASLSSTPPTTIADSISLASESEPIKSETTLVVEEVEEVEEPVIVAAPLPLALSPAEPSTPVRVRRARASLPVYNLAKLSGTDIHGKRQSKGDLVSKRRRRTGDGDSPDSISSAQNLIRDGIDALDLQWSVNKLNTPRTTRSPAKKTKNISHPGKRPTRQSGQEIETLATKLSSLGKRSRKTFEKGLSRMSRELRRLQDTNEFAHIDEKPVKYTTWSNGKYVDPDELQAEKDRPRKKAKVEKESEEPEVEQDDKPVTAPVRGRPKKWLNKGLYAGQEVPADITKGLNTAEKKRLQQIPELQGLSTAQPNKTLPLPLFNGLRLLVGGRDFKLPYDVCNPSGRGQPKPEEWKKVSKNRFVGDAQAYWKKADMKNDFPSKCICKPEDGCGEDCQNRIMLYECDDSNCKIGKEACTNRHFRDLAERTKKGGPYRIGVEVMKTLDRGYGVRTNRCFESQQIIVEYTGEIITDEECERRMNEVYKDKENYYLMSFEQNMILDATTGSIARFVNHSCEPNCRMRKWTVNGQPRVALFAGDRPIMTGEELTYDYKFAPFGKSLTKCLCGSANCRGVLGPRQKETKEAKVTVKAKATMKAKASVKVKAGKRKLKELLEDKDDEDDTSSPKKRKLKPVKSLKRSLSASSLKAKGVAKGAATVIKRSVSTISVNAKAALGPKTPAKTLIRKSSSSSVLKKYGKSSAKLSSRNSSLTIVAANDENRKPGKRSPASSSKSIKSTKSVKVAKRSPLASKANKLAARKSTGSVASPRKALDIPRVQAKIRVVPASVKARDQVAVQPTDPYDASVL